MTSRFCGSVWQDGLHLNLLALQPEVLVGFKKEPRHALLEAIVDLHRLLCFQNVPADGLALRADARREFQPRGGPPAPLHCHRAREPVPHLHAAKKPPFQDPGHSGGERD